MARLTLPLQETFELVEPLALKRHRDGETRLSALALIDEARSLHRLPLNNSHAPQIARMLVEAHPHLVGCFEFRALGRGAAHRPREQTFTVNDVCAAFETGVAWRSEKA